jgi:hypothetical protein
MFCVHQQEESNERTLDEDIRSYIRHAFIALCLVERVLYWRFSHTAHTAYSLCAYKMYTRADNIYFEVQNKEK